MSANGKAVWLHSHEILPVGHFEFTNRWLHFHFNFFMGQYTMAEEFEKYKSILDREWEEFKQQLKREVSTFLSFQIDKRSNIGTKCSWNFVTNFASVIIYLFFFLKFVVYSLQCSSSWYYYRVWIWNSVAMKQLWLFMREKWDQSPNRYIIFFWTCGSKRMFEKIW